MERVFTQGPRGPHTSLVAHGCAQVGSLAPLPCPIHKQVSHPSCFYKDAVLPSTSRLPTISILIQLFQPSCIAAA